MGSRRSRGDGDRCAPAPGARVSICTVRRAVLGPTEPPAQPRSPGSRRGRKACCLLEEWPALCPRPVPPHRPSCPPSAGPAFDVPQAPLALVLRSRSPRTALREPSLFGAQGGAPCPAPTKLPSPPLESRLLRTPRLLQPVDDPGRPRGHVLSPCKVPLPCEEAKYPSPRFPGLPPCPWRVCWDPRAPSAAGVLPCGVSVGL